MLTDETSSSEQKLKSVAWMIPCYNEAITIATVIQDIKLHAPGTQIYVYDNNSTDETGAIALREGAILRRERKRGKGAVVKRMFEEIDADIYIMVDGDATYSIAHWSGLVRPLLEGDADMVVGSRLEEHANEAFRPMHVLGNKFLCSLIRIMFRVNIRDMLSGYRAMSRKFVKGMAISANGFAIETELTIQSLENNFRIREVPAPYRERPSGSHSKLNTFQDGFIILFFIIRMLKDHKPLTFFGSLALLLAALAICANIAEFSSAMVLASVAAMVSVSTGIVLNSISQRSKELMEILRKCN